MAERDFLSQDARRRTADAVRAVEALTSAELVVQVRQAAALYREADYLCGLSLAMVTLLVLLFAPRSFAVASFPVQTLLGFALGSFLSSRFPAIKRRFVTNKAAARETYRGARAAFVDLGVARCSGRWGILVSVSLLERRVELVADIGVPWQSTLAGQWRSVEAELASAVTGADFERFIAALASLGPALATALPRRDDDVNELPDDPADEAAGSGS